MRVVYFSLWIALILSTLAVLAQQQPDEEVYYEEEVVETETVEVPVEEEFLQEPVVEAPPPPPRKPLQLNWETVKEHQNQVLAIAGIFLYLFLYLRGKRVNAEIIQKFYKKVDSYLEANFAHIGFSKESGEDPFIGESANEALYYASGR